MVTKIATTIVSTLTFAEIPILGVLDDQKFSPPFSMHLRV